MPRGRKSPLNLDGTSVCYVDPGADGRLTVCKARAKDDAGEWQSKRFPVTAWHRDGAPVLPEAAEIWARATRKTFIRGEATAGAVTFKGYADMVADNLSATGVTAQRVELVRSVGNALDAEGIRDMKADTFPTRVRTWLAGLKTGWFADPEAKNRRKTIKPLSAATRNKLLVICRQVTGLAVLRRKLAFDPLAEIKRSKEETYIKPLFTIDELRRMVSDEARDHNAAERRELEASISTRVQAGVGRTEAIKAISKDLGRHWCSIYNALARPVEPDPWWLACCLLTYTGARADEAMHLRWEWIRWDSRIITLKLADDFASKSDSERLIPLEPELAEILRPLAKPHGHILEPHVRAGSSGMRRVKTATDGEGAGDYSKALRLYLTRIGIDPGDRTAHSLRHCFISLKLARADTNVERLRKAVGHADFSTTMGYGRLSQMFEHEVDQWPDASLWLRRPLPTAEQAGKAVVR
jgi:integrase